MLTKSYSARYTVEINGNSSSPILVYCGRDYRKAFRLFEKHSKDKYVELCINELLAEFRSPS